MCIPQTNTDITWSDTLRIAKCAQNYILASKLPISSHLYVGRWAHFGKAWCIKIRNIMCIPQTDADITWSDALRVAKYAQNDVLVPKFKKVPTICQSVGTLWESLVYNN